MSPLHARITVRLVALAAVCCALVAAPAALARHVPDPATAPSATALATGKVNVRWTASRDGHVVAYRVFRAPTATLNFVEIGQIASTLFTDAPGSGAWSYRVVAVDGVGTLSAPTADFGVDVPRGIPAG